MFGNGKNKVSFTYLDNYCHGLILGYDALYKVTPVSYFASVRTRRTIGVQLPDGALEHAEKRVGYPADWTVPDAS